MQSTLDSAVKKYAPFLLAGILCVFAALQLFAKKNTPSPELEAKQIQHERREIASGPRFAILKGFEAFTDPKAVAEFLEAANQLPNGASDDEQVKVFRPLRLRQLAEGRRIEFSKNHVVRFIEDAPGLDGFCRVIAENPPKNKDAQLWVEKSLLRDENDLYASRALTGFWIFRGKEGLELGGQYVTNLKDLLAAIYAGEIDDDMASQCVFMPEAQGGEAEAVLGQFVIYQEHHPDGGRLMDFAMNRSGNDDPLFSGPVRYVGREGFTTRNGTVRMIPVFKSEPNVKPEPNYDDSQYKAIKPN